MTTSQKVAISLLIAVLLFGGFSVLSFGGLFNLLETRFYNPSVTAHMNRDITQNAEAIDKFFAEARERFSETLKTDAVRHSLVSHNADYVSALSRVYSPLIDSFYGVQWVRFVDGEGQRLLFSSYGADVLDSDGAFPVYADYNEPDLPYEVVAAPEDGTTKYTFDGKAERIIFSFPLYDSFDIYKGTALFSLSVDAISARLASEGRINHGENITVISNPGGVLFGMPASSEAVVLSQVSESWGRLLQFPRIWLMVQKTSLDSPATDVPLLLLSTRSSHGFFIGRLINEDRFLLPVTMKVILLLTFFLTTYLIIFLLFNIKQDPLTIVQNRLKQLEISLIEEFYERKGEADWARWIHELENRREEIHALLKRGIKTDSRDNIAGVNGVEMDILINKSWDELLAILGRQREAGIDEEKISSIINKLLEARTSAPLQFRAAAGAGKTGLLKKAAALADKTENTGLAEETEVLDELDTAEDLGILSNDLPIDDEVFKGELEVVSPFAAMVFDSSHSDDTGVVKEGPSNENRNTNEDDEPGTNVATDAVEGLPLITTPFSGILNAAEVEALETFDAGEKAHTDGDVIQEREGVHYISEGVLTSSSEAATTLNREFKKLVDAVTK